MWFIMKTWTFTWLGLKLKNTLCTRIQSISMAQTIYWVQHTHTHTHTHTKKSRKKMVTKMGSIAQINEQCCIQKNNGKLKK